VSQKELLLFADWAPKKLTWSLVALQAAAACSLLLSSADTQSIAAAV